ncbi:MAG: glycerophosphodiester phosphodiesterase family protein [Myxococcota bacterium]|nr:glycerophosphodiester phosphodiesterase family protein [Myxococcota bacterium]
MKRTGPASILLCTLCFFGSPGCSQPAESGFVAWLPSHRLVIGHRGSAASAPENTLVAIDAARDPLTAAEVIEVDLARSADGEIVLLHDGTVDRTTGEGTGCETPEERQGSLEGSVPANRLTADQLAGLDAGFCFVDEDGTNPFRDQGIGIPSLSEVLLRAPGQRFLLDIEHPDPALPELLVEVLIALDATSRVCVRARSEVDFQLLDEVAPADLCLAHGPVGLRCWTSQSRDILPPTVCPPGDLLWPEEPGQAEVFLRSGSMRGLEGSKLPLFVDEHLLADEAVEGAENGLRGILTGRPDRLRERLGQPGSASPPDRR